MEKTLFQLCQDLTEENNQLRALLNAKDKIKTNSIESFRKLRVKELIGKQERIKYQKRIAELKEQLAIREKALELACEKIVNTEKNITFKFCYNFYLEQAKENLK